MPGQGAQREGTYSNRGSMKRACLFTASEEVLPLSSKISEKTYCKPQKPQQLVNQSEVLGLAMFLIKSWNFLCLLPPLLILDVSEAQKHFSNIYPPLYPLRLVVDAKRNATKQDRLVKFHTDVVPEWPKWVPILKIKSEASIHVRAMQQ